MQVKGTDGLGGYGSPKKTSANKPSSTNKKKSKSIFEFEKQDKDNKLSKEQYSKATDKKNPITKGWCF